MGRYEDAAIGLERILVDEYPLHRDADLLSARLLHVGCLVGAGRIEQARHEAAAVRAAHPSVSSRGWSRWHFQPYRDSGQALRVERLLVAAGPPR